jgi:TRAP-type C4-dicarboxylate transport system permease large subunit
MDNPTLLMIVIMVLVIAVGTAMDMTPTILILTPVLMPVVKAAGIDPVYFGVLFIMNNAIGLITPPVGTVLNVVAGVGRMKMDEVTRGVLPFMVAQFASCSCWCCSQADAVVDGPFGQKLHAKLPDKGIVGLAYWELGFRNITNGKRPSTRWRTWPA